MTRAASRARQWCLAGLLALGLAHALSRPATARTPAAHAPILATRGEADSAAVSPPSRVREQAMAEWAGRAPLAELVWVLRRPAAELGSLELPLVDAALARVPAERASLRQRLLARHALAVAAAPAPANARARAPRKAEPGLPDLGALRPYASVFRVAALLPDRGEYAAYGRALRAALAEGLAWGRPTGAYPIELDTLGTGESDPQLVAEGLEQAAARADVIVGELLSGPTLSLATATRLAGLTLVSPTATDERVGRAGPHVFQVGPGGATRARVLAEQVLRGDPHGVALAGSASGLRGEFAAAFARETEARDGRVVRRDVAGGNGAGLAPLAAALKSSGADVLLWEGSSRDGEALIRALAAAGASLHVCGGPALAPDAVRPAGRALLEGVTWVEDDWHLPERVRAHLDSLALASGMRPGSLWTRGFLAGRRIAAALDAGALTGSEVAAHLRASGVLPAAGGFLDVTADSATVGVYVVRRGRSVPAAEARDQ